MPVCYSLPPHRAAPVGAGGLKAPALTCRGQPHQRRLRRPRQPLPRGRDESSIGSDALLADHVDTLKLHARRWLIRWGHAVRRGISRRESRATRRTGSQVPWRGLQGYPPTQA